MKRVLVSLTLLLLTLLLASCSPAKQAPTPQEKCDMTPGYSWEYVRTRVWYTYTYQFDGKGNLTGMIPLRHERDIYECRERT